MTSNSYCMTNLRQKACKNFVIWKKLFECRVGSVLQKFLINTGVARRATFADWRSSWVEGQLKGSIFENGFDQK